MFLSAQHLLPGSLSDLSTDEGFYPIAEGGELAGMAAEGGGGFVGLDWLSPEAVDASCGRGSLVAVVGEGRSGQIVDLSFSMFKVKKPMIRQAIGRECISASFCLKVPCNDSEDLDLSLWAQRNKKAPWPAGSEPNPLTRVRC